MKADATLHHGQDVLLWDFVHKHHGVVAGVGYGKTKIGPRWMEIRRRKFKRCEHWLVIAPNYKLLKLRCFDEYEKHLQECGLREGRRWDYQYNRSLPMFTFNATGQKVIGLTGEKPIVSYNSGGVWRDESALMDEEVRKQSIMRNRNPFVPIPQHLDTTTPEGLNWVFDVFAPEKLTRQDVISFNRTKLLLHGRSHDNPYLTEDFLQTLEDEFAWDPLYYANYVLGEWVSLSRNAFYFAFDERRHVDEYPVDYGIPQLVLSWDKNVGQMTWVVMQPHGPDWWIVAENGSTGRNIHDACQQFINAFPPAQFRRFSITVLGDAVLWHRSEQTYTTGYQIIETVLKPHYPLLRIAAHRGNPFVEERSRCTNHLLSSDRLKVDRSCRKVIMSAKTAESDGKGGIKKPHGDTVTHAMEAVDMGLIVLEPPRARFESVGATW